MILPLLVAARECDENNSLRSITLDVALSTTSLATISNIQILT
jgi:hypothetical protein